MLDALGEFRVPLEATMLWLQAFTYPWPHAEPGKGKLVMLIPGFLAGDITLAPLANFCRMMGHRAAMSGTWSNSQCPREALERLGRRLERVTDRHQAPLVVVGQSLGGIYARELGHRYPDRIERVIEARQLEEVSIGDYVLSGGEIAAMALIDACVRLLPGVMGKLASGTEESFSDGLLEYPQYTRPQTFEGQPIPEILTSGDHARVAAWRQAEMANLREAAA